MAVAYGDPLWAPPSKARLAPCLFWVVPDVHHGFPSPWRFWAQSGLLPDAWPRRAAELALLLRALPHLDLPSLGRAARVCRAWRRAVYCARNAWLAAHASLEVRLDLPHLGVRAAAGTEACDPFARPRGGCLHPRRALRDVLRARRRARAAAPPSDPPRDEAALCALERRLDERLPVDAREALRFGALPALVGGLLGDGWATHVWPCDRWARADALRASLWPRLEPRRAPRRPVVIGHALAVGASADTRRPLLALYDGRLFAAAGAAAERWTDGCRCGEGEGSEDDGGHGAAAAADEEAFCVCYGELLGP